MREIRGNCPVCKVEDRMEIDYPKILMDRTDVLCTHMRYQLCSITSTYWNTTGIRWRLGSLHLRASSMLASGVLTPGNLTPMIFKCRRIERESSK